MKHMTIFDKPYPENKQFEGMGVSWAFVSGACNECEHLWKCNDNDSFIFPDNAPCMVKKHELEQEVHP